MNQPYTHAMHARRCQEAAQAREVLRTYVQVKTCGLACCARLIESWTGHGTDFFKVEGIWPFSFFGSYPAQWVRQCSGLDGRCACAGEVDDRAKLAPHASAAYPVPGALL